MEPMLKAKEVAQILNISLSTVYEYNQKGILPAVHVGSMLCWRMCTIGRFLEENEKHNDKK